MDNTYQLCHRISLLGPEEFKLDQMRADEIKQIRHVGEQGLAEEILFDVLNSLQ